MFNSDITILRARALIQHTKWSKHSLAIKAGLSKNGLRSLDSADCGATTRTIAKLKKALDEIEKGENLDLDTLAGIDGVGDAG